MVNLLGKEGFSWLSSVAVYRHPCTRKRGRDKKAGDMALPEELTVGKLVSVNEQSANVKPREHNRFVYSIFLLYVYECCVWCCVYICGAVI